MKEGSMERRLSPQELIAESWQDGSLTLHYPDTVVLIERYLTVPEVQNLLLPLRSHHPASAHHSIRAAHAAVDIAQELRRKAEDLRLVGEAGLLHDIGKTDMPLAILDKPSALTEAENRIKEEHVRHGLRRLTTTAVPLENRDKLAAIIGEHHEHITHRGKKRPYPRAAVRPSATSDLAQILVAAETFDALKNPRDYRKKPLTLQEIGAVMEEDLNIDHLLIELALKRF